MGPLVAVIVSHSADYLPNSLHLVGGMSVARLALRHPGAWIMVRIQRPNYSLTLRGAKISWTAGDI